MFCPHCGSENKLEKYCRQCGLSLTAVRLALDGRIDEARKICDSDKKLWPFRIRIAIASLLVIIALATIVTGGKIGFSNLQSAGLIFIITVILLMLRWRKSYRVAQLLDAEDRLQVGTTKPGYNDVIVPGSITEQATLELKRDDSRRKL